MEAKKETPTNLFMKIQQILDRTNDSTIRHGKLTEDTQRLHTCTARMLDYAEGGGAKNGIGTALGMEGIGGSVTFGTVGIGGKVTLGTAGMGGNAAFGTVGTAGIGGRVAAGTAGTVGIGGTVTAGTAGTAGMGGMPAAAGIVGTAGIGGRAAAGTVGTGGFGTAGMPGTAAGAAAGVVSARWRAAWLVLLPASMSAMTSAVAKRAEAEAMTDLGVLFATRLTGRVPKN